jgi:hypothetical protein
MIAYSVGAAGTGGTSLSGSGGNGVGGGNTTFVGVTTANGGGGGAGTSTASSGGSPGGSAGTGGSHNGGSGAAGSSTYSGGGGGSAGNGGNGGSTSDNTAGSAGSGGGVIGAAGKIANASGSAGGAPGAGGSGGFSVTAGTRTGGAGGAGQIIVTVTYYSQGNLDATLTTSWNSARDGSGSAPANFISGDIFIIQGTGNGGTTPHAMTMSQAWTISGGGSLTKLEIENGAKLTATFLITVPTFQVDNGGTYVHNAAGSSVNGNVNDLPGSTSRSFGATSTVEFQSWANGGGSPVALPSGINWGNLTINVATLGGSWNQAGNLTTVSGNLTIKSTGGGAREFRLSTTTSPTVTISGNLVVNGGILNLSSSTGIPTINVSGSTTISSAGTFKGVINKNGSTDTAGKVVVTGTLTYGGTLTVTASGDTLASGDSFTLFTNTANPTAFSGWFSTVTLPGLTAGLTWDTNKLATTGVLDIYSFTTTPLAFSTRTNQPATLVAGLLLNHAVSSRGTVVVSAVTQPANGATVLNGNGSVTYTPAAAFAGGSDSFTITFQDGHGLPQTIVVSATVNGGSGGQSPNVLASGTTNINSVAYFYANFAGVPGQAYTVETNSAVNGPGWVKEGNYTAPSDNTTYGLGIGVFQVMDPMGTGSLYYRTVWPAY